MSERETIDDLCEEGEQSALTLEEAAKVFRGMDLNGMADICEAQAAKQRYANRTTEQRTALKKARGDK